MPIILDCSNKLSFSTDDINNLFHMLNTDVRNFNVKHFQDFLQPKLRHRMYDVHNSLYRFLDILDSSTLEYIGKVVRCPGKTVNDIWKFLEDTEIEINFRTLNGASCRIGLPLPPKPTLPAHACDSSKPVTKPSWVPAPPEVNPGWQPGYSPFRPVGIPIQKTMPHPNHFIVGINLNGVPFGFLPRTF